MKGAGWRFQRPADEDALHRFGHVQPGMQDRIGTLIDRLGSQFTGSWPKQRQQLIALYSIAFERLMWITDLSRMA